MRKPKIAVTMGDPAGVGPEVCLHALTDAQVLSICTPVVFGDRAILNRVADVVGHALNVPAISQRAWSASYRELDHPVIVDQQQTRPERIVPGTADAVTGRASYNYIEAAIAAAKAKQVSAVTTAPINKKALHLAGIDYPGHTEIFADRFGANRWCMMQYSEAITCTFVTVHCGYRDVPGLLSVQRILDVIQLSADALQRIRNRAPRIVVCGLNPHAGEESLFGNGEEERIIAPAIEESRSLGLQVEGPVPPDTAFLPWKREVTDVYVCMYHDQGHIPVKALAFDKAVNTTLGLPMIRTSVDHGTALDIAWQGKVNPSSLLAAIELAVKLAEQRSPLGEP